MTYKMSKNLKTTSNKNPQTEKHQIKVKINARTFSFLMTVSPAKAVLEFHIFLCFQICID